MVYWVVVGEFVDGFFFVELLEEWFDDVGVDEGWVDGVVVDGELLVCIVDCD